MTPSRREALHLLAALGVTGAAGTGMHASTQTPAALADCASALGAPPLPPDQLEIARRALRRNLDAFDAVRQLEIDDAVVPAVTFAAGASQR